MKTLKVMLSSIKFLRIICKISILIFLLIGLLAAPIKIKPILANGSIIYVNQASSGANDGSSWLDAYNLLQSALDAAVPGKEVWVASGVYYPTNTSDRTATFQLASGVAIYGGFGGDEITRGERDWESHETVLSGDIGQDDTGEIVGENAYHVVFGSGVDETAVLDGFVIRGGKADGSTSAQKQGGGVYNYNGHPTLANLTIRDNQSSGDGGGVYSYLGNSRLEEISFIGNQSGGRGGGMYTLDGSPTLEEVVFYDNAASGSGGGLYNEGGAAELSKLLFEGNSGEGGGGMYNNNSSARVTDVIFRGNTSTGYGSGGGMCNSNGSLMMSNVLFSGNVAYGGGGLSSVGGSPSLNGVTVSGNRASHGGGIYGIGLELVNGIVWGNAPDQLGGGMTATHSIIQGGYSGEGNLNVDPIFVEGRAFGEAPTVAGNYRLRYASPAIDMGEDSVVTLSTDLDGNARIVGAAVDMGAYEYQLFTLTIDIDGGGYVDIDPEQSTYTFDDQVTLMAVANPGWIFSGWSGDVVSSANPLTFTIKKNTVISVKFGQAIYLPLIIR